MIEDWRSDERPRTVSRLVSLLLVVLVVSAPVAGTVALPAAGPTGDQVGQSPADVSAAAGASHVAAQTGQGPTATQAANDTAPPDPDEDVLGWESGYWHNESIDVDPDDGLNDTELDAVVARGMARVEYIRGIEFESTPPVEVITRDEFVDMTREQFANLSEAQRLHQNVKFEALFMIGEDESAVEVQRDNRAGGVGGFYDFRSGEIKVVSNNVTTPKLDEITLSQELFHALQDQKFDIASYNQSTRELHNARDGIIEGDGNYVDRLYRQECESGVWANTCLLPEDSGAPADFDPHLGLYQITFQPYSSGPAFVADRYRTGGWEAVDEVYENPPESTEQTIHPEKYGEDDPAGINIDDTSQEPWRQLELNGSDGAGNDTVDFAQFGEAGLYVALWYPGVVSQGGTEIIPINSHINRTADGISEHEPYLYEHPATAGWDGDKLVAYTTDDSAETNETGYVYETVWDSESDAADFRDAWLELMEFHGAEPVEDRQDTYRIPDDREFGDAFYLTQEGETVTVVNAPTVADLSLVREGAAPEAETSGSDDGTGTDDGTEDDSGSDDGVEESAGETGPGFGVLGAVVAVLAAALVAVRRLD